MSNLRELGNLEVGALCLALSENSDNDFRRAQILRVNGPTVNIFLVDYGVEENNVPVHDLIEIPQRFITCLPFQVTLIFVRIDSFSHSNSIAGHSLQYGWHCPIQKDVARRIMREHLQYFVKRFQ